MKLCAYIAVFMANKPQRDASQESTLSGTVHWREPPVNAAPNAWHIGSVTSSTALTLLNRIEVASEPAGDQQ